MKGMPKPQRSRRNTREALPFAETFVSLRVLCGLLLFVFLFPCGSFAKSDSAWSVQWQPRDLVNGSPVLFRVKAPAGITALKGTWAERTLDFRFSSACQCWFAIAGIDLDTKPGKHTLELKGSTKDNAPLTESDEVLVHEKQYPLSTVTLPPAYVQPPPEVQARVEEEQALKKKLFGEMLPEAVWSGRFRPPVATGVSGGFGAVRVVNGVKGSPHQGTDFHAKVGTTVRASNAGKVFLARNLYFEGNCVMIDHGQGLATIYMHLSKIKVKEGQTVARGQIIALSGNSGRSTGPHLHFAVRWQGSYLDGKTLLTIVPPGQEVNLPRARQSKP
jgi:murein DD-endopeptidase MepM/ murein hydrolase activator NlpD